MFFFFLMFVDRRDIPVMFAIVSVRCRYVYSVGIVVRVVSVYRLSNDSTVMPVFLRTFVFVFLVLVRMGIDNYWNFVNNVVNFHWNTFFIVMMGFDRVRYNRNGNELLVNYNGVDVFLMLVVLH